jgi:hypothetical protein
MPSTLSAKDVPSSQPKVHVTIETWDLGIDLIITSGELHGAQ